MSARYGDLIVFEGPDAAGKTTICDRVRSKLRSRKVDIEDAWFPGRTKGTLGQLIYDIHHRRDSTGVGHITPAALQTLHVASHIDQIQSNLIKMLESGKSLVLDRYWWSTYVYGRHQDVDSRLLEHLVAAEMVAWQQVRPKAVFLVSGRHRDDVSVGESDALLAGYQALLALERDKYPCHRIENNGAIEDVVNQILGFIE